MPKLGEKMSPEHKAAILAAKALKKLQAGPAGDASISNPSPSTKEVDGEEGIDTAAVGALLDSLPEGQLGDLHALALQVIKDALVGLKVLVNTTDGKTPQLLKGTVALWKADTPEGGRYVYGYRPDIKLAQFVAQHSEGKPGTKELQARATQVVFHSSLPGHDEEINRYLRGLPEEVLAKFGYGEEVMAQIKGNGEGAGQAAESGEGS